jgi:dihydrofolate reductase
MSINRCIGKNKEIPWNIPDDMKHFKKITTENVVVVGRKTHEIILKKLGRPLSNRKTLILTKDPNYVAPYRDCEVIYSNHIKKVLDLAKCRKVFVIGGGEIYKIFLPYANTLIVTLVNIDVPDGDTFFPEIGNEWKIDDCENFPVDANRKIDFSINTFKRRPHR